MSTPWLSSLIRETLSPHSRAAAIFATSLLAATAPLAAATRKMFVTDAAGPGKMMMWASAGGLDGLAGADKICQTSAENAGLANQGSPDFRAWLSTDTVDAYCHILGTDSVGCKITGAPGPWYRTDGNPAILDLNDLVNPGFFRSEPYAPPTYTENGVGYAVPVWTGTDENGGHQGDYCGNWTSNAHADSGEIGFTTAIFKWSANATSLCDVPAHLYCFEVGSGDRVPTPRAAGAEAFVTSAFGPGDPVAWGVQGPLTEGASVGGLAGGDEICRTLARNAHLPSPDSFLAWLSDGTTNAKDRFTIAGPWNRRDGSQLADSLTDLTDFMIRTDFFTESGERIDPAAKVWTGTTAQGLKTTKRCNDWSSSLIGDHGDIGTTDDVSSVWSLALSDSTCNVSRHLYCLGNVVLLFWDNFESGDERRWSATTGFP